MKSSVVFVFLAAIQLCLSATVGPRTYQASVEIRSPTMQSAFQRATLIYESNVGKTRMRLNYTGIDFFELYSWSGGTGQYLYKSGSACKSTCETSQLNYTFPKYYVDDTFASAGAYTLRGTTYPQSYTPPSASDSVARILVSNNQIAVIMLRDGRDITFLSQTQQTSFADTLFISPSGCTCGNRMDISIVVDRSGSIRKNGEWNHVVNFTKGVISKLSFGTTGIYLGLSNFNHATWITLPITEGITKANAESSVPRMDYCRGSNSSLYPAFYTRCTDTNAASEDDPCCYGYTCIECAVEVGIQQLKNSPRFRDDIDKVLIVITDGTANHQPSANNNAVGADCNPAGSRGLTPNSHWSDVTQTAITSSTGECWNQIYREMQSARATVPRLHTFSIGIGTNEISTLELEVLAGGDPTHYFQAATFSQLTAILDRVIASVCIPQEKPCGDCCGLCLCGECTKPTSCEPSPPCTVPVTHDTCCINRVTPAEIFCPPQFCKISQCNPNISTNGGCYYTNSTSCESGSNVCTRYQCQPSNGACTAVYNNPDCYDACTLPSDCGNDPCKIYTCYQVTLYDAATNTSRVVSRCNSTDKVCDNSNLCMPQHCNASGLCQVTPVVCARNPPECWNATCVAGLCEFKDLPGANCDRQCEVDLNCTDTNQCNIETCVFNDTGIPVTSKCNSVPITDCNDLDLCHRKTCIPDQGCVWQNVTCPFDDPEGCFTWSCVDGDCKKWVNPACIDLCVNDTDCFTDHCLISECVVVGKQKVCNHTNRVCPGMNCSTVRCDPQFPGGCTNVPFPDDYCDDFNPCTIEQCVEGFGCQYSNKTCPRNESNPCILAYCIPELDCITTAKECNPEVVCREEKTFYDRQKVTWRVYNTRNPSSPVSMTCDAEREKAGTCECELVKLHGCSIAACNQTSGNCQEDIIDCGASYGVDVALVGGVSAGVIAAIVIGVAACIGLTGTGAKAVYDRMDNDELGALHTNPLFESNAKGGANPLHAA